MTRSGRSDGSRVLAEGEKVAKEGGRGGQWEGHEAGCHDLGTYSALHTTRTRKDDDAGNHENRRLRDTMSESIITSP